jgi:pyruvate dehydrogenase E2 component (dihydrolipoamide acetyltransferase)
VADFTLPNLGENVPHGDVLRVLVKPGDTIARDQPVLELETDKATIEVPSSVAGTVKEIKVKPGDKVKTGQVVLVVDNGGAPAGAAAPLETAPSETTPAETAAAETVPAGTAPDEPKAAPARVRAAQPAPAKPAAEPARPKADAATAEPAAEGEAEAKEAKDDAARKRAPVVDIRGRQTPTAAPAAPLPSSSAAPASPSVRRVAREIGVDIAQVTGSGPHGRITEDDVKNFAKQILSGLGGGALMPAASRPASGALPDFAKWGEVERKPMTGIRRKTAEHLTNAWLSIPHVTQFDKADMTVLEEIRPKYAAEAEKAGGKLTVTAVLTKIVATALRRFPQFNASIDVAAESIIYKKYVHIGIAVDTEHGLLVPVVRNADQKNILQIAAEIQQLAEKAKARKLSLDEMSGGSMSITNLGGIGGTAFTPIVNWPEVAILGVSRGSVEAIFKDGEIQPRQMLPLSLSYDHRVIDGADAIRFLRWVVEAVEQPFTVMLRG